MDVWKNIRLELGRTDEFPRGSVSRGYLIRLPLDDDGMVDRAAFALHPHRARVRRYWSTEPDQSGEIIENEGQWALCCNGIGRILQLDCRRVRRGYQVSIIEEDGTILPYNVACIL